ncbi:MAG TPA: DUF4239 domain-containing protein [Steroidobacteraceae bacterium]|nr:DUF4239 domain-containing protein [Steroidobacteraceae bacterium]
MSFIVSHPSLLFLICLTGLMLVVEIGIWLRRFSKGLDEGDQALVKSARDGLTVLLSFLLGFAVAMTLPYYEARRDLITQEANAISTLDERAQLLPDPYDERIRQLLPQYVDARLEFARPEDQAEYRAAAAEAGRLESAMWHEIVALVRQHPELVNGPIVAQVSAGMNSVEDFRAARLAADERRIPSTIWLVLSTIAVITCFVVGYGMQRRLLLAMFVLPLTVAIVLSLVAELENPRTGFIRIQQASMLRVRQELREELGH